MFGRSKKKEATIKVRDKVWIGGEAKLRAFLNAWKINADTIFIFWFDDSLQQVESFFAKHTSSPITLLAAREVNALQLAGKKNHCCRTSSIAAKRK